MFILLKTTSQETTGEHQMVTASANLACASLRHTKTMELCNARTPLQTLHISVPLAPSNASASLGHANSPMVSANSVLYSLAIVKQCATNPQLLTFNVSSSAAQKVFRRRWCELQHRGSCSQSRRLSPAKSVASCKRSPHAQSLIMLNHAHRSRVRRHFTIALQRNRAVNPCDCAMAQRHMATHPCVIARIWSARSRTVAAFLILTCANKASCWFDTLQTERTGEYYASTHDEASRATQNERLCV